MNDSKLTNPRSGGRLQANYTDAPRRATHGGSAWSLPTAERILRQPQDGALTQLAPVAAIDVRKLNGALVEQEDAHLNGTLRSLARRVLGPERHCEKAVRSHRPGR